MIWNSAPSAATITYAFLSERNIWMPQLNRLWRLRHNTVLAVLAMASAHYQDN
jgi:hypothetical protein